jgi:hypothetical protein
MAYDEAPFPEPWGPEYVRPAGPPCPDCTCCTKLLCETARERGVSCSAVSDSPAAVHGYCSCTAVKVTVEPVTPEQARQLLENMWPSRQVNWRHVDELAERMASPSYDPKTMVITVDQDGRMFSGQHVAHAIIKYGRPCTVRVVRGPVPRSVLA